LAFVLTPGQAADGPRFRTVLDRIRVPGPTGRPRTRPDAVTADKAYSSKANRAYLRRRRITAVIPEKADQQANRKKKGSAGGRPVSFDPVRYRQRTPSNAASRRSRPGAAWPPATTRHHNATKPDCTYEERSCG
jgi:predicted metal-dependent phosphoesterase TrpH